MPHRTNKDADPGTGNNIGDDRAPENVSSTAQAWCTVALPPRRSCYGIFRSSSPPEKRLSLRPHFKSLPETYEWRPEQLHN